MTSNTPKYNKGLKKEEAPPYGEVLVKCAEDENCDYQTKIKVNIGNNQRILLLIRHYKEEYYLIIHQHKLIVAYPMYYTGIAPEKSIYSYKGFYERGDDDFDKQNKRGHDRCMKYEMNLHERSSIPVFKGFNDKSFSMCCSCFDIPFAYENINTVYPDFPKDMRLECPTDNRWNRKLFKERLVSIKRSVRHLLPFYAIFRFKKEVKLYLIFNITIIKKEKSFSDYYNLYEEKTNLTATSYRYVLDELTNFMNIYDNNKIVSISYSSSAFDDIIIPKFYNNYLLYPFYPEELYNIKYDTLDYGCSYNIADKFECIESDESRCTYTESNCLKKTILIPRHYISQSSEEVCGIIGSNLNSSEKEQHCVAKHECIQNTVESYLNKAKEFTKGNEDIVTKLPVINGKYPHYIFQKKDYNKQNADKRTVDYFTDTNIHHYVAYEYYKEDRTEFIINLRNKKKQNLAMRDSFAPMAYGQANPPTQNHTGMGGRSSVSDVKGINDIRSMRSNNPGSSELRYRVQGGEAPEGEEDRNAYDSIIFYMETLNELRIINILYSDVCDKVNEDKCGVLVHVWNPSKEAVKARLKLQCNIKSEGKYTSEKNLVYDEGVYQFLFFFQVPIETFKLFKNCNVYAYGAFKLYDVQTYVEHKKGFIRNLFYHKTKNISSMKLYSDGIRRFICCSEHTEICKIKNIPHCTVDETLNLLNVFFFILFLIFVVIVFLTGNNNKRNRISSQVNAGSSQNSSVDDDKDS
ncbi:hypothetical protein MKS88_003294 [Plasmodium brasilianum]|uniref:Uncharacterized protein n=2 Tax=Plasmodium (Plasmodium) TaxID=418103 RepID=A0A1A8WXJ5_PLAMA|nr:conserved Plasmodium protein, unknown function [Plasmodium malariae]KAI4837875.1 hypothetical protein MKS88_003294 [Plasmodium brasilianum]SBS97680.1 conserved Plasmodium protein, unknown function [Plasmodium malariae]SCN45001.1 conserved Plasmodium protein, unknown function [Plasmodium malariae]